MIDKERDIELHTIRKLMTSENGRSFAYRCLQNAGLYGSIFHKDPIIHANKSGRRDFGVWLENELKEADHDLFLKMLKEHKDG